MFLDSENPLDTEVVPSNLVLKTTPKVISGIIQDIENEVVYFKIVKDAVNKSEKFLVQFFPVSFLTAFALF